MAPSAAVDAPGGLRQVLAGHLLHHAEDALLHRMVEADIALGRLALVQGGGQEAGVLAGAVVVEGGRRLAVADHLVGGLGVGRQMRPALVIAHGQADALDPGLRDAGVADLPVVGGTGQRQLLVAQLVGVERARLDQRDRLDRLDGGARVDRRLDVAPLGQHTPVGIDDAGAPAMDGFHHAAARHLDEDRRLRRSGQVGVPLGGVVMVGVAVVVTVAAAAGGMVVAHGWRACLSPGREARCRTVGPAGSWPIRGRSAVYAGRNYE